MTHDYEYIVGTAIYGCKKSKENNGVQLVVDEVNEDRNVREEKHVMRRKVLREMRNDAKHRLV